jgi:Kef-type K+ transport system membrane component KefB/nucleotide-binding universal stress UspA family protein
MRAVPAYTLLIVAGLGGLAIAVSKVVRRFVPEIVVFLAIGVLIGPDGPIELINASNIGQLNLITEIALAAIIFLMGDRLRIDDLRSMQGLLVPLNLVQLSVTSILVFLAMRMLGLDWQIAAILGLISAETGVLTVTATIKEEHAAGRLTDILLSSVALTNVAVAALFGLAFPIILATSGEATGTADTVRAFAQITVASGGIGMLGGLLLKTYGPTIESSGELLLFLMIVLTGMTGATIAVEGSVVVTALVAGLYVANATPWLAERFFAAVRTMEAPIYLIFFIVAGADIHLDELAAVGLIGLVYVIVRTIGKIGGSTLGALAGGLDQARRGARVGVSLLPHAGMAIALAAFVSEFTPELGAEVSPIVLGSIVVFELTGPLLTRKVLRVAGDAGQAGSSSDAEMEIAARRTVRRVLIPLSNRTVLVPRLPFLLDLVGSLGAEVVAVHVSNPSFPDGDEGEPEVLALFRQVAQDRAITCTVVHRRTESVAGAIVDVATAEDVDLIVMGEPARTTLLEPTRWGLISQRVVRESPVPVLVYPVDPSNPEQVPDMYLQPPVAPAASPDGETPAAAVTVDGHAAGPDDDGSRPPDGDHDRQVRASRDSGDG